MGPVWRRLGSLAFSVWLVGEGLFSARVMSISCSSVGFSCALTSEFWSVGWRSVINRGDTNCSCA